MSERRLLVVLSCIFRVRGGIPRFNQMLCLALDELAPRLGLEVRVISQDDSVEDYRVGGAAWRHVQFVPGHGKYGVLRRSVGLALRERPALMLVGLLGMTPVGLACLPFVRRGFGFVAHGYECWRDHALCDRRWSRHAAARRARFVFAVSSYTGAELAALTGIPRRAILDLPNTLEPGFDRLADSAIPASAPDTELLSVSRLWPEDRMKGVDHTLEAFARLASRHPAARYRIVGQGADKPRLVALAAALGLEQRVVFEEDLTDEQLAERYRRCAAFVLPSGQEGFGIVFLEAMRFARPCVGGNAGGTPEVIADGETGLLVPYGDVTALERALDSLLADPGLRERLGRAGRERLIRQFTFERYRERLAGHLERLLGTD